MIKVTITKNVTSCATCPHFSNGPYDTACELYEKKHGPYSSVKFLYRPHNPGPNGEHYMNSIPVECPVKEG